MVKFVMMNDTTATAHNYWLLNNHDISNDVNFPIKLSLQLDEP